MPGTSRLVPEASVGADVAGRGRDRSARCPAAVDAERVAVDGHVRHAQRGVDAVEVLARREVRRDAGDVEAGAGGERRCGDRRAGQGQVCALAGGRGAAEPLADRAASDHDGPGGGGRLEEAASVERRGQVVAVDVPGQQLMDQDPRLAVLLGLDLLDACGRRGTGRRERLHCAAGRRCGPSAPLGCGRRAVGPRGGRRTRRCAEGPQQQEERRRPRGHEGQGGQQAQHRRTGCGAVGEPGDRGHQAEQQERPQRDPGPT